LIIVNGVIDVTKKQTLPHIRRLYPVILCERPVTRPEKFFQVWRV